MSTKAIRWKQRFKNLEDRNLSSHLYDEETADKLDKAIRENYLPLLNALYERLRTEL